MNVSLRSNDGEIVEFEITGRVDQHHLAQAADPLVELAGEDVYTRKVLIDISHIPMLDSSGVGWFLKRHKLCNEAGGCLVLHSMSTMTQNVFKVLKMHLVINIASTRKAAVEMVNAGSS